MLRPPGPPLSDASGKPSVSQAQASLSHTAGQVVPASLSWSHVAEYGYPRHIAAQRPPGIHAMPRTKSKRTAPHPIAAAIAADLERLQPAEPQPQSIPPPVWSVLRGFRRRGRSIPQIMEVLERHGYHADPDMLATRLKPRTPLQVRQLSPDTGSSVASTAEPTATHAPADVADAAPVPGADPPPAGAFTAEQRAQYQIPQWADGSDIRNGETLEKYARRKRIEGSPESHRATRRKFIGES